MATITLTLHPTIKRSLERLPVEISQALQFFLVTLSSIFLVDPFALVPTFPPPARNAS